ncbi:MAG TPA: hypothetical protein VJ836_03765 [Candidatus Saccharimonadales bacterium]|nr:hypothetical protein [Candidatus Saccharimonadales bacterium]
MDAGAPGFPFGPADHDAADMGSVLFAAQPGVAGPVFAGSCLLGALVALAMLRPIHQRLWRWLTLTLAWLITVTLVLVLPDIRLLQNFAYALLFVYAKLDWYVLNQAILMLGGICFAVAAIGYQRRSRGACSNCGRTKQTAKSVSNVIRWGHIATYIAVLAPLPYGLTRLAWALGIPLGIDQDILTQPLTARIGEAALASLAIGGSVVTLGLIRPWGDIWPRWIPLLAGRRIPITIPALIGGLIAILITTGALALVRIEIMGYLGLRVVPATPPTITGWAAGSPGWLWPFWGIALGVASLAYYYRRRSRCKVCGRN